jgi:uncharacterized protein
MPPLNHLLLFLALALPQSTPSGGAIAKFVPPVPTPASFIADPRGLLSDSAHRALDARITAIQRDKLGDVGVALIPSIGDYSASQVGVEIYRTWKIGAQAEIGSEQRNLGVLLLIVPKELSPSNRGECWITTGMGSEAFITDAAAGSICRNSIIPFLQKRDYAQAIRSALVAIENRMRTARGVGTGIARTAPLISPPAETTAPVIVEEYSVALFLWISIVAAILFGVVVFVKWRRHRRRRCPRCGQRMIKLDELSDDTELDAGQRLEEKLHSVDWDVWACSCGESMAIPYTRWFSSLTECRQCRRRTAARTYVVLRPATTVMDGRAENRFICQSCHAEWKTTVVLPVIVPASSSSGGGGHGGGGGGGGGSSFGGSGSTSGGGGGSSY